MEDAEVLASIALSQAPGVGPQRFRELIRRFGSAAATIDSCVVKEASRSDGERLLEQLGGLGARALIAGGPDFPESLAEIPESPVVLYAWGDVSLLSKLGVAFVGSRDHSPYGAETARVLVSGVAPHALVISGMARGIDAIVHQTALDVSGRTIGVLGNGFGVVYPASNRELYDRAIAHGCLVTEHPPGEPPHQGSFPRRNRLISGLARAVVVIEADKKSGALVTAQCALDQGKPVLCVPGPITSRTSTGCNAWIQQGAKPALTVGDILEEIGLPRSLAELGLALSTPAPRVPPVDLTGLQLTLWNRMTGEPQHVDALVALAQTGPADVLGALTELELRGLVRQGPGMVFGLT